eukprot:3806418-Pleurochrysis_carterae.AAC.1
MPIVSKVQEAPPPTEEEVIARACVHACTHARTHASTHARKHPCTHARTHARTHAHMLARTHARTHARTQAREHTYTLLSRLLHPLTTIHSPPPDTYTHSIPHTFRPQP